MSVQTARMNRQAIEVTTLDDVQPDWRFWLMRPPAERLEALELLRQIHYGYNPATERLQRIPVLVEHL